MAPPASFQKINAWVNDRLSLDTLLPLAEKKEVPIHKNSIWYYLGGAIMVLIGVQVVTGLLLMVYYVPELKSAHTSILFLNTKVDFGWFIRSVHSWAANLMILGVFAHMFSTFLMKAYRPPREITWLTGMGLLVLAMGFGFTGYLLPWDDVSFFATKIGVDITSKMPLAGPWMAELLRGGGDINQATLSRFFVIHVGVLPLTLMALLGIHLFMIQLKGMSESESFKEIAPEKRRYEKFFPDFLLKDLMIWLLVLNAVAILATLAPWGLGTEADPAAPAPMGIKPEWYFLAMYQFLKLMPTMIGPIEGELAGIGIINLVALGLLTAPFIDKGDCPKISKIYNWFGILVLIGFVVFTIWGAIS